MSGKKDKTAINLIKSSSVSRTRKKKAAAKAKRRQPSRTAQKTRLSSRSRR